jgi:hypothetical protein
VEKLPYIHSPEEGTPEADAQPWTIRIPLVPEEDEEDEEDEDANSEEKSA